MFKTRAIFSGLLLLAFVFIYWWDYQSLSPFFYTEADDFYGYISIEDPINEQRKMVIPFGVFSVEKEGRWLHVTRMDVSIIECRPLAGKFNEGTLYKNRLEYWALHTGDKSVYGPMNKSEKIQFLKDNSLEGVIIEPPRSYNSYINDLDSACDG